MAVKTSSQKGTKWKVADSTDEFVAVLRQIPTHLFVQMVSRAGVPTEDARALCDAFRRFKQ